MIARTWRGAVRREDADAYAQYMEHTGVAEYAATPGNRCVLMLRRDDGDVTEFLMVTLWDSMESVRAFAGPDATKAVFYDEDDRFLVEREEAATHFETLAAMGVTDGDITNRA